MPIEQNVTRKLRAILSADVKGYSILMADDEVSTVQTLKDYRSIMSNCIGQHNGRVVDAVGDNLLAEFGSAVDAVQCAVDVQKKLNKKNEEISEDKRLQFRIGVNIGDVIQDGERIFGDGVNIAARIEGLADAGGISISRNAYDHIKNKLNLGYEYIGEHDVKNIKDPVRVYKVLLGHEDAGILIGEKPKNRIKKWVLPVAIIAGIIMTSIIWHFYQTAKKPDIEPASIENMALQLPDKPSIAVLPFNNFSKDPGQEYIADGITEHIITTLSKSERLFIIARNSVFKYKGKPVAIKQISEDLGVKYILEGSVQISNNKIRITAQLIDAIRGSHIWAQTYDKNLGDIFHLQDEIALKILKAMRVELTEGEQAKVSGIGTDNLKAYLQYLKCIEQLNKFTKEGTALARMAAQAAIDIDPMYSSGYRLLASAHLNDLWLGVSEDPKLSIKKAVKLLEKAHALDEDSPGYYYLKGQLLLHTRQHDKAITFGEQAVNLSPNNAGYLYALATILRYNGEHERALLLQKRAIRLNPYPPSPYYMSLGHIYLILERYEEAIQSYRKAVHLNPEQFSSHMCLAAVYSRLGLKEEARAAMSETLALRPKLSVEYVKTLPFRHKRDLDFFITALEEAGLPKHPLGKVPEKPSIAVLPFTNMSNDPEQEYFSDGMTDELIGDLAKINDIFVISRNSAFTYKGKSIKAQEIANDLNVRYILEGSVQRSGNKVRIRAQLIDGKTDHHLWSESYDGVMDDIFDLQDKITGKIVSALSIKLTPDEMDKISEKGTDNLVAYDAYLKGFEHYSLMTGENLLKGVEYYHQAIEIDPSFSRAHTALAATYWMMSWHGFSRRLGISNPIEIMTLKVKARHFLEIAMKNPNYEAYRVAAWLDVFRRKYDSALANAEKSVELAPNSNIAHGTLAGILIWNGRHDEALAHLDKAMKLDPKFDDLLLGEKGITYYLLGDYNKAVELIERSLKLNPGLTAYASYAAASYAFLGQQKEAERAWKIFKDNFALGLSPTTKFLYYGFPFKDEKVFDRFLQGLVKAGFQGDPSDYYSVHKNNKLSGDQIQKLFYGKTAIGYVSLGIEMAIKYDTSGKVEFSVPQFGISDKAKSFVENDQMCFEFEKWYEGIKSCSDYYNNPEGTHINKSQFISLNDIGMSFLSIQE